MQRIKLKRTALSVKTLVSVMFISLILARISYADIDPETCVGLWTFDKEADVVKDLSGNENNGRLVNGPKWVAGKFSSALEFDGVDDYVDCGNDASLNPEDTVTILSWNYERRAFGSNWYECCRTFRQTIYNLGTDKVRCVFTITKGLKVSKHE